MTLRNGVFVAAVKQHCGKTTSSLGLVSGIARRLGACGFMKPVGQQHIEVEGVKIDKDVKLVKDRFGITSSFADMSPVLIPPGYTKRFLDGAVDEANQYDRIRTAYDRIEAAQPFTVVEGTGHAGVGTIIGCSNADVARALDLEAVLVASGGLGSAIDELALNVNLFQRAGVPIRGVILNRVLRDKYDTVMDYFARALQRWDIPLLGGVPYEDFLTFPTFLDFQRLFNTHVLAGSSNALRHVGAVDLVATELEAFLAKLHSREYNGTAFLTHSSRTDIVLGLLEYAKVYEADMGRPFVTGVLLTGTHDPSPSLVRFARSSNVPVLHAKISTASAIASLQSYTAKLNAEDTLRTDAAIDLVEGYVDFDKILARRAA